ncbi:hypothetical protein FKW77_009554 [Venturia effusa]|uniref:Uncharacterized protein n=1 Tax=Venturia effusa TaxID=50376 RepID=A0A517LEM4_9PEZI|nr:hypothetical protein FKW77_009554 [Venturia effusa]
MHLCLAGLDDLWMSYGGAFKQYCLSSPRSVANQQLLIEDLKLTERADYPPWHRATDTIGSCGYKGRGIDDARWTSGGSGLIWYADGSNHSPFQMDVTEEAMRQDIEWLVEKVDDFTLPATYNHISVYPLREGSLTIKQEVFDSSGVRSLS